MIKPTATVVGVDSLIERFKQMERTVQEEIVKTAIRGGLQIVEGALKNNSPYRSGYLKRSTRISIRKSGNRKLGLNGPYGELRLRGFYGRFLEFGAAAHWIEARDAKLRKIFTAKELSALKSEGARALKFRGYFGARVWHPGIRGRGFMRRSWDESKQTAIAEIERRIRTAIRYSRGRS